MGNEDPNYLFYHSQDEKRKYYVFKHLSDKHFQESNCTPANTLILNFNYTQTAKQLYARDADEIIDIHGALNTERNPTFSAMAMNWTMITNGLKNYKTMTFSKISSLYVTMKQTITVSCWVLLNPSRIK